MDKSKRNILIVLVGFPFIYILYSLLPWSKELFANGNNNLFIPFWGGVIILHWVSLLIVKTFLKQENKSFKDIGYGFNTKKTLILVFSYLSVALLVFAFTEMSLNYVSIDQEKLIGLSNFFPKTTQQRLVFIIMAFTAGFCEEIIYRGFAITKLTDVGINKWLATVPAGISFTFTHGIIAVTGGCSRFLFYFVSALIFGVIFILSRKLTPNIIIHLLFDLAAMMAIFQAISK
jgi:membrane protease YdiL (CAAX protease family)